MSRDPEIRELTDQIRSTVGKAYRLSRKLDLAVSELTTFGATYEDVLERMDRRFDQQPYDGEERRGA